MTGVPGAPSPVPGAGERYRRAVSALSVRNYRLFFVGQFVSVLGNQMQAVAIAFLTLSLTDSGTALGVAVAARLVPLFVLGPLGGLVADRIDRRRVLYVTQTSSAAGALLLAGLAYLGAATYPVVIAVSLAVGALLVVDNPARQTLIAELVDRETLANAVVLNSVSINVARALGSVVGGGLVAATGAATGLLLNAFTFAVVVVTLVFMRTSEMRVAQPVPRRPGQVREGWAYTLRTPEIALPLLMLTVTGTFAYEYPTSLPLLAVDAFSGDARTFGSLAAAMAVGSVLGGLVLASRKDPPGYRTLPTTCVGWGVATLAAAVAPSLAVELAALVAVGWTSMSFNATSKTAMQLAARPDMRGRVMSLWAIGWTGSTVLGGPLVGAVGEHLGSRYALVVGGVPTLLLGVVVHALLRRRRGEKNR